MPVYPLHFVQRERCFDDTEHKYSLIYTFFSSETSLKYVVRAEHFSTDAFAVKFYAKKDKRSPKKYSRIINRGDALSILRTVGYLLQELLAYYPTVSFALVGTRSIDLRSNKVEGYSNNQRYRIYRELIQRHFGYQTFTHFEYPEISSYMLVNNNAYDVERKRIEIEECFKNTYPNLLDIE